MRVTEPGSFAKAVLSATESTLLSFDTPDFKVDLEEREALANEGANGYW